MKTVSLALILLFFSYNTYSQYIEGQVLDADTSKPIENVHVYMDHIKNGDITNARGRFYLNFGKEKIGSSSIHFSHVSYDKLSIQYVQKKPNYTVYLSKNITDLSEIQISEKTNLKPSINFTKLASMNFGIRGFGAVLHKDKIYVIGGDASYVVDGAMAALDKYRDTEMPLIEILKRSYGNYATTIYEGNLLVYDLNLDSWEIHKDKFNKRAYHNVNLYKNELFVFGGTMFSKKTKNVLLNNTIEIYDLENETISVDETYPHQALNFASFVYQDNLLVMGGSTKQMRNGLKEYSNNVHLFDLKTGYWYALDSMSKGKETSGVLIKDKIYLIGGYNKKPLTEIETFDLITKKWTIEGHLFYGLNNPAITFNNNIIYLFNQGRLLTYNTLTKELNEFLIDLNLVNSKMFYANDKLLILGGLKTYNFALNPSSGLYSIDISEFDKTNLYKSKSLK